MRLEHKTAHFDHLTEPEQILLEKSWRSARSMVKVKNLPHEGETYVLAQSEDRIANKRSMRRRCLLAAASAPLSEP
jgi:hypothetical protein